MHKPLLKINLQNHAGVFHREDMENPLLVEEESTTDIEIPENYAEVPPEGGTEQTTEESDETVPDNSMLNQDSNTNEESNKNNEEIKSFLENMRNDIFSELQGRQQQHQQPQVQEPTDPKEPTTEELQAQNDELYNKFVENPLEVIRQIKEEAKQEALQELQPIKQHYENEQNKSHWNNKISEFRENTPDFNDYVEDVIKVINEKPHLRNSDDVLEIAYKLAKADRLQNEVATQPKTLEDFLANEETMKQAMGNEKLRNAIIQDYVKNLNDKNNDIPTVIGSQKANPVLSNPEKPKDLRQASKLALNFFNS